jgi:hypothetical protein
LSSAAISAFRQRFGQQWESDIHAVQSVKFVMKEGKVFKQ